MPVLISLSMPDDSIALPRWSLISWPRCGSVCSVLLQYHQVYLYSFVLKAGLAALLLLLGSHSVLLPAYLLLASACVAVPLKFFGMMMSDLVDEQKATVVSRRQAREGVAGAAAAAAEPSTAGLYQSTHALFAKPLNSLGPILASFALAPAIQHRDLAAAAAATAAAAEPQPQRSAGISTDGSGEAGRAACFMVVVGVPLLTAGWQYLVWKGYDFRGAKAAQAKATLRAAATGGGGGGWRGDMEGSSDRRHSVNSNYGEPPLWRAAKRGAVV